MTGFRLFLTILIFSAVSMAWLILGLTVHYRTADLTESLSKEVDALWGPSGLVQPAPYPDPQSSDIQVDFAHTNRYKGLIWFSTYMVDFAGTYTVSAPQDGGGGKTFTFNLPSQAQDFQRLEVTLDDETLEGHDPTSGNQIAVSVPADGKEHKVSVAYRTAGRDRWEYDLGRGSDETSVVRNFTLTATTDFPDIDYPKGTKSPQPDPAQATNGGMKAVWKYDKFNTRQQIGIEMPARTNAGPIASRMALYAPVSLFFFFTVMFTIVVLKKIPLHPMHYLFISAGFFAFHILLAYLVDKFDIHYAFWICAVTSAVLVVSYMRLVTGGRFAVVYVGLAQLVYLVGFSYAFFWVGWTGLTIVVVAIITLFVLMQATGRLDWNEVFEKPPTAAPPAPPTAPAPQQRQSGG